ncbi:MAG: nitrogenase molybdenum-iron protein subunit beta [Actinobacteria bacterium]|nr:nitrogenase molybdenum-iron protein subunit beta [Actinomycetota bacterium]
MLEATPRDCVTERKALTISPAKTCQPVGAVYAALGVHGVMPHSHGSQGCIAFHRMFLTRHFKEPAMASTSAFTEGTSVFGGGSNLKTAVRNIFDLYDPEVIAIHTTCLSETIGDDLNAMVSALDIPEGKRVIYCSTPSYQGSHVTGFSSMSAGFIRHMAEKTGVPSGKLMINPGFVNPGDMRELKKIVEAFGIEYTMLPDTTGVLDAPMTGTFEIYPKGGTPIDEVVALGDAAYSLALGQWASEACANELRRKHGVEYATLPLPMGVAATDEFILALSKFSKQVVPYSIEEERGQLIDCMIDSHQYLDAKRVAIYGDPDTVIGVTAFCLECGMKPAMVVTGTPGKEFTSIINGMLAEAGIDPQDCWVKEAGDLFEMHQRMIQEPVDLMIGPSTGKQIARAEDVPLVRVGFPIIDRYVHPYMPIVGYKGAMRMLELIATALMERMERDCEDQDFEFVM